MEHNSLIAFLQLALRIIGLVVCSKQAKYLNRSTGGWAVAGFIFPVIAMIWVYNIKRKPKKNTILAAKPFTTYYTQTGKIEVENNGEKKVTIDGKPAPDGKYQLNNLESIDVYHGKIKSA